MQASAICRDIIFIFIFHDSSVPIWRTFEIESLRKSNREVERAVSWANLAAKVPTNLLSKFLEDPMSTPLAYVTSAALKLIQKEIRASRHFELFRISASQYLLTQVRRSNPRDEEDFIAEPWQSADAVTVHHFVNIEWIQGCNRLRCVNCLTTPRFGYPCRFDFMLVSCPFTRSSALDMC